MRVGILSLQGDVSEHIKATESAAAKLRKKISIITIRNKTDLLDVECLIIPGGESTTLQKLCERAGIFEDIKCVRNLFGTCAGAIMLAKKIRNSEEGQKSLGLMDIEVDRNAYGRQAESFEQDIDTKLGNVHAVFIRAPKIIKLSESVVSLAESNNSVVACEQKSKTRYFLALCFHPELTTTCFHEHFLKNAL